MLIAPEIQARLNVLLPEINAKAEFINGLTQLHILRECHLPRREIDTRALGIAAEIVRENQEFRDISDIDQDIWAYAIAGYIASQIRRLQRNERAIH